ncbi:MAG: GTPase HflX [Bacteroidales bacterium]|jgi:GTP-binding protein HflX|nr:GTPase HflX [Bacteroidales bacterium]
MIETKKIIERAVLVGVADGNTSEEKAREYLNELAFLVTTSGAVAVKIFLQNLPHPDHRTYVGSGKLEEIRQYVEAEEIDIVVFDDELSPAQTRNVEAVLSSAGYDASDDAGAKKRKGAKVLDRTRLILDIFALHARSAHARTQVELAQYQYMLPRLTRMWSHLSRQRAGVGARGPGEKEIETDRRVVNDRISLLKERLREIDKQKITQRKNREKMVRVALVGYTNVGKSTLMNIISKSDILAENKLFATLDTTVRKVVIGNLPFLMSDTVGFIRKLPHHLVESFKSTLDEVRESDILLHVVDLSHPEFEEQIEIVEQTLSEIGVADKCRITVFNKIDAYRERQASTTKYAPDDGNSINNLEKLWVKKLHAPAFFISAKTKENLQTFRDFLYTQVRKVHVTRYPYDKLLYEDF